MSDTQRSYFIHDISLICLSIIIAILLVRSDALSSILQAALGIKFLGSLIAGIFFTTVFTTAPAIVALGEISKTTPIIETALFGAAGAVLGDLLIFQFIKDKLSVHFDELVSHSTSWKRIKTLFRLKYFRWFTFLLGGLIIASPFPDELGISLLGFSRMNTKMFVPISFIFNFLGILTIGIVARAL